MAEPTVATTADRARARFDHIDRLCAKSAQLKAALGLIWGDGFEAFDSLNTDEKDGYVWLLNDLARDVYALVTDPILG